jgi:hypothetical protein
MAAFELNHRAVPLDPFPAIIPQASTMQSLRQNLFFELRLDRLPKLQLDNREIIAARLIPPGELRGVALTGPAAAYLGRTPPPACSGSAES